MNVYERMKAFFVCNNRTNLHIPNRFNLRLTFMFILEMFHQTLDICCNFTEITIEILERTNNHSLKKGMQSIHCFTLE